MGARLGADIPFCIVGGGALVTGIGECLEEVPTMPDVPLAVACMGEGVSTPWAYGQLDALHNNFTDADSAKMQHVRILNALSENRIEDACADFYNLFEEVVPTVQPYVDRIRTVMNDAGAIRSMMSGSGPSVFGVFRTVEEASEAVLMLRQMGAAAFVCHPKAKY